jgi:hypothetical protein
MTDDLYMLFFYLDNSERMINKQQKKNLPLWKTERSIMITKKQIQQPVFPRRLKTKKTNKLEKFKVEDKRSLSI